VTGGFTSKKVTYSSPEQSDLLIYFGVGQKQKAP
jgi:hypothetical protein